MKSFILAFAVFASGCSTINQKNLATSSTKKISGKIYHKENEPYTFEGPFHFTKESYATVALDYCDDLTDGGDCQKLDVQTIKGIARFPIDFAVYVNGPEDCTDSGKVCMLSFEIHQRNSRELEVGDLVVEWATEFRTALPINDVKVQATGLENCGTPTSGGFCL